MSEGKQELNNGSIGHPLDALANGHAHWTSEMDQMDPLDPLNTIGQFYRWTSCPVDVHWKSSGRPLDMMDPMDPLDKIHNSCDPFTDYWSVFPVYVFHFSYCVLLIHCVLFMNCTIYIYCVIFMHYVLFMYCVCLACKRSWVTSSRGLRGCLGS